jgi:hypothetical protein
VHVSVHRQRGADFEFPVGRRPVDRASRRVR